MKQVFPGPGTYEPLFDQTIRQAPTISVKKDKKMKDISNINPGPGNYNISRELGGNKFR